MKQLLLTTIFLTAILSVNAYAEFAITSITPNEGPITGNTAITIKLSDSPSDILLPLIFRLGNVTCTVKEARFLEGKLDYAIVLSGAHEAGLVDVEVIINSKASGSISIVKKDGYTFMPLSNLTELPLSSKISYKKPPALKENSVEWLAESFKGEKNMYDSFFEDLFNNKPGDSWNDYQKYFEFTLSAIAGYGSFILYASKDNLLGEARLKSIATISIFVIAIELIESVTNNKSHFCAKDIAAGISGAAIGGAIITLGYH